MTPLLLPARPKDETVVEKAGIKRLLVRLQIQPYAARAAWKNNSSFADVFAFIDFRLYLRGDQPSVCPALLCNPCRNQVAPKQNFHCIALDEVRNRPFKVIF